MVRRVAVVVRRLQPFPAFAIQDRAGMEHLREAQRHA
jgi:hypothetical protein